MRILLPALLLLMLVAAVACMPVQPEAPSSEAVTLYVGPELVDCVGVGPMKCMQVKSDPEGEYEYFYDTIEGFEYEDGFEYELEVQVDPRENPPADASAYTYTLLRILNKQPVAMESTTETWIVAPALEDCEGGAGPQKCMMVKKDTDGDWEYFYDSIEGFDYEEDYRYEITVQIDPVEDPPADGSSYTYTLVEVVDKQPVTK